MNKNKLKSYAPQARRDFIEAVKARAALLGISASGVSPATRQGDVVIVEGREWPAKLGAQRDRLAAKIAKEGFEAVMDRVAYTWFNRFAALRYMELHDYLGHGYRVLSNTEGGVPEILAHAHDVDLPGLDREKVVEMRLAGNRDGDLYRMVLVAQCNALSSAMPFLFERIDDESELLLPDNLLRTDSLIAKMVSSIDEEDWREVEIIGWLYQFYISERKEQVIGNVSKSEEIPAATQLFTPNWIVKYLVQNSVGRLWLQANPSSTLKSKWEFYIENTEQPPEVVSELAALVTSRIAQDGERLNPESITVLDPACGSGHILVEVFDILKDIYLERGYQPRAIPRLILEKNIFALDIDERATQLAGFALAMRARADDRRLFSEPFRLNVVAIKDSAGLLAGELETHLSAFGVSEREVRLLLEEFFDAKTLGSLVNPSSELAESLQGLEEGTKKAGLSGDVFAKAAVEDIAPLIEQARLLLAKFDVVVANPPYMGMRGMFPRLKQLAKNLYADSKADLFSMFIERGQVFTKPFGLTSMVTMHSWMFLSSFEVFRSKLLASNTILSLAHFGPRAFPDISGEVVQTAAFCALNHPLPDYIPTFLRLVEGDENQKIRAMKQKEQSYAGIHQREFLDIPGAPLAYWVGEATRKAFSDETPLAELSKPRQGLATSDNGRFLRLWHEVSYNRIGFNFTSREKAKQSGKRWFPCQKGGAARRWYGNHDWLVNWENDGKELLSYAAELYGSPTRTIKNMTFYFREGITWSTISTAAFAMRYCPTGFISETKGAVCFFEDRASLFQTLALTNTKLVDYFLKILSPTLDYHEGPVGRLPVKHGLGLKPAELAQLAIEIAKSDWDSFETSWDFKTFPWASPPLLVSSMGASWKAWSERNASQVTRLAGIEGEINAIFISAYGLEGELTPEVAEDQITLTRSNREADCKRLVSYAVGCMMGRYSLDEPGLVYAHAGNTGFDPTRYKTFPADSDGIVPMTDELWFEDEAALRVSEFVRTVWGSDHHEENMAWLAESLGAKNGETPDETVRRYLATSFYKDHLQTYKKRPIYWLFTSGKLGAFGALVYLHRYHEGTLSRMRSEYVVPLLSKYLDRIEMLQRDAEAATSAATRTKIQKRIDGLRKKHHELVGFEERLRHLADSRIALDLDDGVKANYGKFGDLLAETKAITGGSEE